MRAEVADDHGAQRSRNEHADPVAEVRLGADSTELGCLRHVRSSPDSDRIADIAGGPVRAKLRHGPWRGDCIISTSGFDLRQAQRVPSIGSAKVGTQRGRSYRDTRPRSVVTSVDWTADAAFPQVLRT
jgi:hypothetical protein